MLYKWGVHFLNMEIILKNDINMEFEYNKGISKCLQVNFWLQ